MYQWIRLNNFKHCCHVANICACWLQQVDAATIKLIVFLCSIFHTKYVLRRQLRCVFNLRYLAHPQYLGQRSLSEIWSEKIETIYDVSKDHITHSLARLLPSEVNEEKSVKRFPHDLCTVLGFLYWGQSNFKTIIFEKLWIPLFRSQSPGWSYKKISGDEEDFSASQIHKPIKIYYYYIWIKVTTGVTVHIFKYIYIRYILLKNTI